VKRGCHKIATVSRLSGFSPELLRAWESRHHLLSPSRGAGGQRLYSDDDLAVLRSVRSLLDEGRSIGEVAALGRKQLLESARAPQMARPPAPVTSGAHTLERAVEATARLSARLDPTQLLDGVVDTLATDFQAALARIWVYERDENVLLLRSSAGLSRRTTTSPRARIDLSRYRYKVGVVARTGKPFVSNAIVGDNEFDQRWVHRERLASVAILPLMSDGWLQGVLASFFRVALSEEVIEALGVFAAVAAASIASHRPATASLRLSA